MNFSIIIPSYKNDKYLDLTLKSILKNSKYKHQVVVVTDESTKFIKKNPQISFLKNYNHKGLCSSLNKGFKICIYDYILFAHDDMYFLPGWDTELVKEIKHNKTNFFYYSSMMLNYLKTSNTKQNHITYNAGKNIDEFDEKRLLNDYKKLKYYDIQGSHLNPSLIHKSLWKKVGGYSEDFDPGFGSDPDFNMKLWKQGVRIFKIVNASRVYHFGSLTTRKRSVIKKNNGRKLFLRKWGITIDFFTKYYLQRGDIYSGPLCIKKNFFYYIELFLCKLKWIIFYG